MAASNRHRLAAKLGIVALFYARVERIHIDMDDLAEGAPVNFQNAILLSYRARLSLAKLRQSRSRELGQRRHPCHREHWEHSS
jgi:hypothetical protein